MLILIEGAYDVPERDYTLMDEIELLGDIYPVNPPVYVVFREDLRKQDDTKARGGYVLAKVPIRNGVGSRGFIFIDAGLDLIEAATILIHEYSHHLSQQNHGFVMYELYREWLREEFVEKWNEYTSSGDRVIKVGGKNEEVL